MVECKRLERYVNFQCMLSMKGVFLFLSITTFIVGCYFVSLGNEDHRASQVELYDDSVRSWTASARSEFQGVTATVDNGTKVIGLVEDTSPDALHDKDVLHDLVQYDSLKYSFIGPLFGSMSWNQTAGEETRMLSITIDQNGLTNTVQLPVKVYKTKIYPSSNQKNCRYQIHGSWRNSHCQTYHRIQRICIQLNRSTTGQWQADADLGGVGCTEYDKWNPAEYAVVTGTHISFGHGEPPVGEIPGLSQVELMLRSSRDPFIDAMARTHDSGNFGETSHEEYVVGFVLMAGSLLLAIPLLAHLYTVRANIQEELLAHVNVHDTKREGEWAELNKLRAQDNL
jgi:hypothetical protein